MRILREDDGNSQLSGYKQELEDLQKEIQEWREQQREDRRRQLMIRRLELRQKRAEEAAQNENTEQTPEENNTEETVTHTETGGASYYADKFNGRTTASGEVFSNALMTAAHKTLPFGSRVRVTHLENQKTIEVVINDRGPFVDGRVIDLSSAAFSALDNLSRGVINVKIEVLSD